MFSGLTFRCSCGQILGGITKSHAKYKHNQTLEELIIEHPELKAYCQGFYGKSISERLITAKRRSAKINRSVFVNTKPSKKDICLVHGCLKLNGRYKDGYCQMHHQRWIRHGDVETVLKTGPKQKN